MSDNKIINSYKPLTDHNPVMVQRFGADPYALVYNGRVYLYMTGDKPSYNADKTVKENTYGNINTINVISIKPFEITVILIVEAGLFFRTF